MFLLDVSRAISVTSEREKKENEREEEKRKKNKSLCGRTGEFSSNYLHLRAAAPKATARSVWDRGVRGKRHAIVRAKTQTSEVERVTEMVTVGRLR